MAKTQLKQTLKHIPWGELPEQERFNRLPPSRPDDARSLIRYLFLSEADILPDRDNKTLNVCLHYTAEARHNRAIEHLLQHLNDVEYTYPGTELTLKFSLGAP